MVEEFKSGLVLDVSKIIYITPIWGISILGYEIEVGALNPIGRSSSEVENFDEFQKERREIIQAWERYHLHK